MHNAMARAACEASGVFRGDVGGRLTARGAWMPGVHHRSNATATSPTIFIDFAETLSIVSPSV